MESPYMYLSVQVSTTSCFNTPPYSSSVAVEKTQALVVTALGSQRPEHMLRPKLDTILDLAKDPHPVHG